MCDIKEIPCLTCPVLAMCKLKVYIDCELLINYLNQYANKSGISKWMDSMDIVLSPFTANWRFLLSENNHLTAIQRISKEKTGPGLYEILRTDHEERRTLIKRR